MHNFFAIFALATLASAQGLNRPNSGPGQNFGGAKVTLTATEIVEVTSCAPVTRVCGKTVSPVAPTTTKAATTTSKVTTTVVSTTSAKPTTTLSTTTKSTTTTAVPSPTSSCFRIQARSPEQSLNNAWVDSPSNPGNLVSFVKNNNAAGLYTLDSTSQLRNAHTGAVASRSTLARMTYGPVWMTTPGKRRGDDQVTCTNEKGTLKCTAAGGSKLYSIANNLYIAKDANVPRFFNTVDLITWPEKCPAGMPKM